MKATFPFELKKLCKPGATVWTVLRHVSASGMTRWIDLYVIKKNEPMRITWHVSQLVGTYDRKREALKVGGCGMDMGFHVVHNLSYALHGFKSRGPDADEAAKAGRPFTPRPGHYRGGYSLNHRWL